MITNPNFIENEGGQRVGYDLFSRLLKDRIILIFNDISDDLACSVVGQLLYLEMQSPDKDITIYVNSQGGSISAGLAIYDTIRSIKCDVSTVCVGTACSVGALILAAGTKGKRYGLENCTVMLHQPNASIGGQASDIAIAADYARRTKERVNKLFAACTSHTVEEITADSERANWMYAEQAQSYGIIDRIVESKKDK